MKNDLKKILKSFLISFISITVYLLLFYFERYYDDVFDKNIPVIYITEYIILSFFVNINLILTFAILITSIIFFGTRSNFKNSFRKGFMIVSTISIMLLLYNSWILPKAELISRSLMRDFRYTQEDVVFKKSDSDIYKGFYLTQTIFELTNNIDSINTKVKICEQNIDSLLKQFPDSSVIKAVKELELEKYNLDYINITKNDLAQFKEYNVVKGDLNMEVNQIDSLFKYKTKLLKELIIRIVYPMGLILLYLIGSSFGFVYRNQKPFLIILAGLTIFGFYYHAIYSFSDYFVINSKIKLTNIITQLPLLFLIIFLYKSLKNNNNIHPNKM